MKQLSKLIDQTIEKNKNLHFAKTYWTHYNIKIRLFIILL